MRLQKRLLYIALLGIILAIYGANNNWFNSWIEFYLNSWDINTYSTESEPPIPAQSEPLNFRFLE
jgi:hypothetical protein